MLAVRALTSPLLSRVRRQKQRLMLDKGRPRHLALSVTAALIIVNKHKGEILGILALSYDHTATTALTKGRRRKSVGRYAKILDILESVQFDGKI